LRERRATAVPSLISLSRQRYLLRRYIMARHHA
jgi:hypothetical protein